LGLKPGSRCPGIWLQQEIKQRHEHTERVSEEWADELRCPGGCGVPMTMGERVD